MAEKKDKYGRKEPPEHDEWIDIWHSLEKADRGWIITGPIYAIVSNWKALVVIFLFIAWLNSPDILDFLAFVRGDGK